MFSLCHITCDDHFKQICYGFFFKFKNMFYKLLLTIKNPQYNIVLDTIQSYILILFREWKNSVLKLFIFMSICVHILVVKYFEYGSKTKRNHNYFSGSLFGYFLRRWMLWFISRWPRELQALIQWNFGRWIDYGICC